MKKKSRYNKVFKFRIDDDCLRIMKNNVLKKNEAAKKKITVSEYIRNLIIQDNLSNKTSDFDLESYKKMLRTVAGLGNNINQIAHKMNMDIYDKSDLEVVNETRNAIEELNDKLREIIIAIKGGS